MPAAEDVLAVLASLDPPEAYIPDELRDRLAEAPAAGIPAGPDWRQLPGQAYQLVVGFLPGAVGVVALVIVNCVVVLIIAVSEGVLPWLVTLGLSGLAQLRRRAPLPHLVVQVPGQPPRRATPQPGSLAGTQPWGSGDLSCEEREPSETLRPRRFGKL